MTTSAVRTDKPPVVSACPCHDPAVFGHIASCPLDGWKVLDHNFASCSCAACIQRRKEEVTAYLRILRGAT